MYDFIAIGDTVTDDFIDITDARIDTDQDRGDQGRSELCLRFGDKVPYRSSVVVPAVGNAANAAVSATRLGLSTAFVTDIGSDMRGDIQRDALQKNGVECRWVESHEGMESNYHYVLRHGVERTILVKHQAYPYQLPADLEEAKWIYFSSVGEHGLAYHHEIAAYLRAHPNTQLAFQPGTFQISLGADAIADVYKEIDIFFCNKEEAALILKRDTPDIKALVAGLHALGPKIVAITDGPDGAYTSDGASVWFTPMYPDPAPPVDRTGAGDSFASAFTAALALGKSVPEALAWGPVNSMSVVQKIGAQEGLLTREGLEKLLNDAPNDYTVAKIA